MKHINNKKLLTIMIIISLLSFGNVFASNKINKEKINFRLNQTLEIVPVSTPYVLDSDFIYNKVNTTPTNCGFISGDLKEWLTGLLNLIRIGGLVMTLIFGMLDFTKATLSSDKDALKKAQGHFVKRLIAVVLLFIVPAIISLILGLSGIPIFTNDPFCGL